MSAVIAADSQGQSSVLSTEELVARVVGLSQDMRSHVVGAVDRMQDINRGIHLLSMNARIEAARAGAAGAGFGVVGQELTRMSENMREAASGLIRESQARGADLDAVLTPGDTVFADSLERGWYRVALEGEVLGYAYESTLAPTDPGRP